MSFPVASKSGPNIVDRAYQVAYVCAYRLMRTYWGIRRPTTHGALVALWHEGEVLLVRNSYVPYYSAPGGYVHRGESSVQAALRELREEVGVYAQPEELTRVIDETHDWEGKRDHVEIFSLDLAHRPNVQVDHREVIQAEWVSPEHALLLDVFPPLRRAIEQRMTSKAS